MSSAFDIKILSIPVPDPGGDNKQLYLFRAPTDAQGGGITILSAAAHNGATTAGGTTFSYQLRKYSSAGTPALNGTITSVLGGTTSYWAAGVPKAFTLGADVFIDAGEWVVLDYQEDAAGNPTNSHINIQYVMGKA